MTTTDEGPADGKIVVVPACDAGMLLEGTTTLLLLLLLAGRDELVKRYEEKLNCGAFDETSRIAETGAGRVLAAAAELGPIDVRSAVVEPASLGTGEP